MIASAAYNLMDVLPPALAAVRQVGENASASPVEPVLDGLVRAGVLLLVAAIMMCLFRMLRGPHLADRVLSVEIMALNVVGIVILLSILLESAAFLDVALVVAIIGFTSVIAFAQYIDAMRLRREERRRLRHELEGEGTGDSHEEQA